MFFAIICSRGEMARLRLAAALCVLKIVHVGSYAEMVSNETFQNVALIINVSFKQTFTPLVVSLAAFLAASLRASCRGSHCGFYPASVVVLFC